MGSKQTSKSACEKCSCISSLHGMFIKMDMRDHIHHAKYLKCHKNHQNSHKHCPPVSCLMHMMSDCRGYRTKYAKSNCHTCSHSKRKPKCLPGACLGSTYTGKQHRHSCQGAGGKGCNDPGHKGKKRCSPEACSHTISYGFQYSIHL